jgi:hypothetical protein
MRQSIKKIIFTILISIFIHSNLSAQVVLNKSIAPSIGSRSLFVNIDSAFYQPGASGANCIWNFSDIIRRDSTYLYYVDAKQTPYHAYYNFANIAMTTDHQNFDYFKFDDNGYYTNGSMGYEPENGKRIYSHFYQEEPMLKFPLQLGDSFNSENKFISNYIGTFTNHQRSKTKIKADAYGTLILGIDTFRQTIRIHETSVFNDSFSNGEWSVLSKQILNKYQWYCNGIQAPLLSLGQTIRVFRGDSSTINNNSIAVVEKDAAFKNPFPIRLVYNKTTDAYEIYLDSDKDQKINVQVNCSSCLDASKQKNKREMKNPNAYVFAAKQGPNVLNLKSSEVKVNSMAGEVIEFLIEGDSFQELLYLLIP